jgi:predicted DNA-binding transcriptional regulator AlpA
MKSGEKWSLRHTIALIGENIMKKSPDLFDITDLSNHFGISESTIRRRVRASRNGQSNFPLPLFGSGYRVLWRKADVLAWAGEDSETLSFNPSPFPLIPQKVQTQNAAQIRRGLESLGVRLPPTGDTPGG